MQIVTHSGGKDHRIIWEEAGVVPEKIVLEKEYLIELGIARWVVRVHADERKGARDDIVNSGSFGVHAIHDGGRVGGCRGSDAARFPWCRGAVPMV